MRPLAVVLAVVVGMGAVAATIWVGRYSPLAPPTTRPEMRWEKGTGARQRDLMEKDLAEKAKQNPAVDRALKEEKKKLAELETKKPEIATKPPFPKAEIKGDRVYDFGSMGVNEEKKTKFIIENKGEGQLLLAKGPTNCKCTISNISKDSIPPGGSAEIEMSWTPRETTATFAKEATIWTNDPEMSDIKFKIFGKVVQQFVVRPERNWHANHVTDVQDGVVRGTLTSAIDPNFKITSVDVPDKNVKVTYRPLKAKEKMREGLKAGYEFTVTIGKGIPAGHFRREMQIHTTLEGNKTVDVELTATRSGPILFLTPIGNSRAYWNAEKSLINMGRFPHEAGCKVMLPALVYGTKEKFKIVGIDKDADFVHVTAEPNPEIGSGEQQGVRFIFEIPPGAPPVTRITPNGIHLKLKTNHPKLQDMTFEVEYVSQ
jgi:hypothetical protein